ncbi:uncharacterized protein KGF55_005797 [Candida pseudojiufengensis]|uniref:uncharacterized protein n=1 Tax=Candida pseudojiufengensis TaxID=497109 RepID=UPI002224A9F1|nr:uncharacterized protein KGF55_005797 [Candida pseudojiufengensis]KAI5958454.1 hypothetical protein KGF55_005797 [Candida pseudojiufengensis]
MQNELLDQVQDASTYITYINTLTSPDQEIDRFLEQIKSLRSCINPTLQYCSLQNFLNALLVLTYPGLISYEIITITLNILLDNDDKIDSNLKEELPILNEISLLKTAQDIQQESTFKAQSLGFHSISNLSSNNEIKTNFIKSKILQLSKFHNDINELSGLFNDSNQELKDWQKYIVEPYGFYWTHYGKLYPNEAISFNSYLLLGSLEEKFNVFINPIDRNQIQTLEQWLKSTAIPLLSYYDENLEPLQNWMFHQAHEGSNLRKYGIWNICIRLMSENFDNSKLKSVIREYLASCYYYALTEDSNVSSMELTKTYDTILATLNVIGFNKDSQSSSTPPSIKFEDIQNYETFEEFLSKNNLLSPLFEPSQIYFLYDAITSCQKLYPINKLTLKQYLLYKFGINDNDVQREISKITSNITLTNWEQLVNSVELFKSEFIPSSKSSSFDCILLERLLIANLFEPINQLIENKKINISSKEIFDITLEKLWDSIDQATNLNDKIGHLHHAKLCVDIIDNLNQDLGKEQREEIIKLKRLFKAMHSMKNFKIVVEKNRPFTPKQLLQYSGNLEDDKNCMKLINIILEQNPKSYLAFEKLFRILHDLLFYFNNQNQQDEGEEGSGFFFNKLKTACIESSLVDNNFQFAYNQSLELFEHFKETNKQKQFENFWLTFYQVGKFVSPDWFESDNELEKLEILIKQREILSLTMSELNCGENIKIVLDQWSNVNKQIENQNYSKKLEDIKTFKQDQNNNDIGYNLQQPMNNLAKEIINDAASTTNNASEKISNLFVSGLGWAIGAKK